ncbi:hypothetical protein [Corynebacterium cystitidis]|uniref:hypothetical protein n=1 Tax=Corynebacterium cystitidis TaxID=35757 RepID=UPI00211E41EC|nr:hypothetical protein [Corynebacterium cystitidis]
MIGSTIACYGILEEAAGPGWLFIDADTGDMLSFEPANYDDTRQTVGDHPASSGEARNWINLHTSGLL